MRVPENKELAKTDSLEAVTKAYQFCSLTKTQEVGPRATVTAAFPTETDETKDLLQVNWECITRFIDQDLLPPGILEAISKIGEHYTVRKNHDKESRA